VYDATWRSASILPRSVGLSTWPVLHDRDAARTISTATKTGAGLGVILYPIWYFQQDSDFPMPIPLVFAFGAGAGALAGLLVGMLTVLGAP
jgi:hypothetical protein